MQQIADLMLRFDLIPDNDISGLVEDKFAQEVSLDGVSGVDTILM